MKAIIRKLPAPVEFALILAVCFGLSIAASVIWLIHHGHLPTVQTHPSAISQTPNKDVVHLRNDGIVVSAVMELITLGIALWIGRVRGWSLRTFGLRISWKWTGVGVLLFSAQQATNHRRDCGKPRLRAVLAWALTGTTVLNAATHPLTVARKRGGRRALVACSNANAIPSNLGSLQARPKNEMPTGSSNTCPAGTVMLGYPATAA